MNETSRLRYERKFVAPDFARAEVEEIVKRHPAAFSEAYPPRTVVSIYLDSPAFDRYHDHLAGSAERSKIRIRWYGELRGEVRRPVMEWKIKKNLLGEKIGYPLASFRFDHTFGLHSKRRLLESSKLPLDREEEVLTTKPVLLVWYRRRYFLSADRRFRLTLDWDIHNRGGSSLRGTLDGPRWRHEDTVLELKYARENDVDAQSIAHRLPFRLARYSKYVSGLEGVSGAF